MSRSGKPNIVFFFTDDQRAGTVRALGNDEIVTPALDALCARGTAFTNAYIMGGTCPAVCMPSRAMLHTGRTLFHIHDRGSSVPAGHALLGETLRAGGYNTYGIGKWHNGTDAFNRSFEGGDEIFFGGMGDHWNVPAFHYDPTGAYDSALPMCVDPGLSKEVRQRACDHVPAGRHSSELFADAAIDFIEQDDGSRPFFLYLSFMAPHDPRVMPEPYRRMYDQEALTLTPNVMGAHPFDNGDLKIRDELLEDWPRTPEAVRGHLADYYAMITHIDAQMQRVLDALERQGLRENTLIVFAGDNGLALGQHGLMGKQNLYEHSVGVPLILSGPGVPRGETREAFCYLTDIFPTLCELTSTEAPETVEGLSLAPALRDPGERLRETLLFAYRQFQRGVRDERYKLIEYAVNGRRRTQLFDLREDPFELCDLSESAGLAAERERLRAELRRWRTELGDAGEPGASFWE